MTPFSAPVDVEHIPEAELAEAARAMEALAKNYPNGWGWDYQSLAHVYRRLGKLEQATRYYRKAATYRPTDPTAWEDLACYETVPSKAAAAYRKALKLRPERIDLRDEIEQCKGAAPLLDTLDPPLTCLPPWDLLQPEEILWGQKVGFYDVCDSQHSACSILLQEMRQVIYPDGASYGCYRLIAETPQDRVFSPEYPKPVRRLLTALQTSRLYRKDGRVQDTLDLSQGGWPAFPDCAEGDIAEAAWSVSDAGPGFSQDWEIGQASRYVLIRPVGQLLYSTRPPDVSEVKANWRVDTWTSSGPLKVSTFSSWPELARAVRRHLLRPLGPFAQVQAQRLGSALAVVQWVKECDSDWEVFWPPTEPVWMAMHRKFGREASTAVVLCGMLRALNVRTDLCFPILDTDIPGDWFGKPAVKVFDQEPFWWERPPRSGTALLSLARGQIQMA